MSTVIIFSTACLCSDVPYANVSFVIVKWRSAGGPAARYVTGTLVFRTFERRIQRGILYRIFSVGVLRIIQQLIGIFVGGQK